MPVMPTNGHFPRRTPETNEASFYVANRDPATEKMTRCGPYLASFTPTSGTLQVPATDSRGNAITVNVDGRIWLPIVSGAKARSIVTNVGTGIAFTVIYVQRWATQIEAFVKRVTPS